MDRKPLGSVHLPPEKTEAYLARVEKSPLADRREKTAPVLDAKDPHARAKKLTESLIEFIRVLSSEYEMTPEEVAYMVELASVNIFNMDDFPLTPQKMDEARNAADKYYLDNRNKAPAKRT